MVEQHKAIENSPLNVLTNSAEGMSLNEIINKNKYYEVLLE